MNDDRVGLKARLAQHRNEQGGFVAADAVAVGEGQADIVRLVARRFVLDRDAHVADLLRDEIEQVFDLLLRVFGARGQLLHFLKHVRGDGVQVRFAEIPVPA